MQLIPAKRVCDRIDEIWKNGVTGSGDTVNTALHLESNAKPGRILASRAAPDNLPDKIVEMNFIGGLETKEKTEGVFVY